MRATELTDEQIDEAFAEECFAESVNGDLGWYIDGAHLRKTYVRNFARALLAAQAPAVEPLSDFDNAVREELFHVAKVEFNNFEICRFFAYEVRGRLAALTALPRPSDVHPAGLIDGTSSAGSSNTAAPAALQSSEP